jgi:lysylphosphatidylglycerol synthetase-like protein (DUF2156 family)
MATVNRPFGITLLAVLHVLEAILFFLGGIALIVLGAFMRRGFFGIHRLLGGAASLIGVVVVVVGLLYLGLAWGLWSGKGWAWVVSLILAGLGIIVSLISLVGGGLGTLIVLVLDAIIIYYLFTPRVRTFFGEYGTRTFPQPPTQPIPPSAQSTGGTRFCSNCGGPVQANERFCSNCGKALT